MTSRDKLQAALEHRNGPVPVDFGSTAVTGMHISTVAAMREYYGLAAEPVKLIEPYQMLGEIAPDLAEMLGVDIDGVLARNTLFGFANIGWKEWRTPWGQEILVPGGFETAPDGEGGLVIYPQGDRGANPSGRMPEGGYYFDTLIRQEPIAEEALDPEDNLEEFGPLSREDLDYYSSEVRRVAAGTKGVIANFGGTGLGDIALVPAPFLKAPKGIRDVEEWYVSTVARQDYVHTVFEKQTEIALNNLETVTAELEADGLVDNIDVLFVCGTDFGTQTSTFCSIETFNSLYAPYYKEVNGWVHANTPWKTFKHSCGAVGEFIEAFIESGFDIVNPVQCSAAGMEPQGLKERYGNRVVFWGAGTDTQKTLPFGTPEETRTEVRERLETFAAGGGFVFNAIHNVQAKTPPHNIAAMIDAVKEFNGER